MFDPLCPPEEPLRPCEDDCDPPGLGMEEPARPPPPDEGDGIDDPEPPDEPPEGIDDEEPPEEDDCCC